MAVAFYVAGGVALVATVLVITRTVAVHALLYLVVSLLAVAVAMYTLGAAFAAALEVIIYAGAIMVLFVFVVMLLNIGPSAASTERGLLSPGIWVGPTVLALIVLAELGSLLLVPGPTAGTAVPPHAVGAALYGPYVLGVELASFLLLAGLAGAYHLGRRKGSR